jgi:lipopolysaccharide/colanic/teichoic acid biosynthesis glycosyltransferase
VSGTLRSGTAARAGRDAAARPLGTWGARRRAAAAGAGLLSADVLSMTAWIVAGAVTGAPTSLRAAGVMLPLWPALLWAGGRYDRRPWGVERTDDRAAVTLPWAGVAGCVIFVVGRDVSGAAVDAAGVAAAGAIGVVLAAVVRGAVRRGLAVALGPERVVLVGDDPVLDRLLRRLRGADGVAVVGRVGAVGPAAPGHGLIELPGVREGAVDHVVAAAPAAETLSLVAAAGTGVPRMSLVATCADGLAALTSIDALRRVVLLRLHDGEPSRLAAGAKRALDVAGALAAIVVLAPVLAAAAVAVRLDSPGPVLFRQPRVGRGGHPFVMWKLRTMVADAERRRAMLLTASRDPYWLDVEEDPRVTAVGRWLRRHSIDELPQLWNVVRGEMSLVGPRPLVPIEYVHVPAWARELSEVRPGVTGIWQVSGRTEIPFADMLVLDRLYARSWSMRQDVGILLRTAPAVLSSRGAN